MKLAVRALSGLAALGLIAGCGFLGAAKPAPTGSAQRWKKPPALTIDQNGTYRATVATTMGTFVIQLFAKQSPVAANNFVFLARHDFYNGDKIFRVIKDFMFQTGDPKQNGTGGPGYEFSGRLPPPYAYNPGIVAYANRGPKTNGSQFFVCSGTECSQIGPDYPEIGRVISGMNVVEKICDVKVTYNPQMAEDSLPINTVRIKTITIQGPKGG